MLLLFAKMKQIREETPGDDIIVAIGLNSLLNGFFVLLTEKRPIRDLKVEIMTMSPRSVVRNILADQPTSIDDAGCNIIIIHHFVYGDSTKVAFKGLWALPL